MPHTLALGLVGLGVNSWLQLAARTSTLSGSEADAPATRPFTRRRRHHHVQRSLEWLRWPNGVAEPVNASYYHDAVVDHFDSSIASPSRRWSQRFYLDDRFWCGRGCPVFLYIGGEGPQGPPSAQLFMWSLAEKHDALMLALEHRFYGESRPTLDLSSASLQLLTSAQALADLVRFRYFIAGSPALPATGVHASPQPELSRQDRFSSPPLRLAASARDSEWVAFGGSYPGALAAWLKVKFPAAFIGAIASSAPVFPEFNFEQYAQVVGSALAKPSLGGSPACADAIRNAAAALALSVASGALNSDHCSLPAPLCPCTRPADRRDVSTYYASLMGNFQDAVQYNLEGRRPYVSDVCDAVVAVAADPSVSERGDAALFASQGGDAAIVATAAPLASESGAEVRNGAAGGQGWGRRGGVLPPVPWDPLSPLAAATALFSPDASAPECVPSSFEQDEIAPLTNTSFDDAGCDLDCGEWAPHVPARELCVSTAACARSSTGVLG
jgi:serine protease 16